MERKRLLKCPHKIIREGNKLPGVKFKVNSLSRNGRVRLSNNNNKNHSNSKRIVMHNEKGNFGKYK